MILGDRGEMLLEFGADGSAGEVQHVRVNHQHVLVIGLENRAEVFAEIDALLKGVTAKGRLVGMDVVEVNPMRDGSTRTEQTAIRLLIDTLGAAFH